MILPKEIGLIPWPVYGSIPSNDLLVSLDALINGVAQRAFMNIKVNLFPLDDKGERYTQAEEIQKKFNKEQGQFRVLQQSCARIGARLVEEDCIDLRHDSPDCYEQQSNQINTCWLYADLERRPQRLCNNFHNRNMIRKYILGISPRWRFGDLFEGLIYQLRRITQVVCQIFAQKK